MTDLSLNINISAIDNASNVFRSLGSVISDLASGNVAGAAITAISSIGTAIVGIGAQSAQAAGDFQQAMLNLEAHAGLASSQVNNVSDSLMKMSTAVGKSPTELAQALYPVLSGLSGITDESARSQLALTELKLAAESTAGTAVNTTTVTNAATAAFNAFGLQTNDAATNVSRMNGLFDVMNATVTAGNMQWSNYANKVGDLASKAAQSGVKFTEANAALATFTNTGESVQLAGTHLGSLFQSLSLDTDKMAKRAQSLGMTFDTTKFQSLDLAGKVKYLDDITGHDPGRAKAILGNKTLVDTYDKLKDHINDYKNTLKGLDNAQGATQKAFDIAKSGFNFQLQQLGTALNNLLMVIGNHLLPILSKAMPYVTGFVNILAQNLPGAIQTAHTWLTNLGTWLANLWNFLSSAFAPIWQYLVNIFNTQLVPAWNNIVTAVQPIMPQLRQLAMFLAADVGGSIIFIIGLITGIIGAFAGFMTGVGQTIRGMVEFFSGAMQALSGIASFFTDLFSGKFDKLGADLGNIWGGVVKMFQGAWDAIVGSFVSAINMCIGLVNGFLAGVMGPLNAVLTASGHAAISVGQIPLISAPGSTSGPSAPGYKSPALQKSTTPAGPADPITAFLNSLQQQSNALQQQSAAMQGMDNTLQGQQQNMSQLLSSPALSPSASDSITSASKNASDTKKAADAAKAQDAADARSARLSATLQKALENSSSDQVKALVDQAKAAEAAGKTSMAAFYASQAASLASKQHADATKAANKQAAADKKAAAKAASDAKKAAAAASHHKGILVALQSAADQITSSNCPDSTVVAAMAAGVALPNYATGTGYRVAGPPTAQGVASSSIGDIHVHIADDTGNADRHGKRVADVVKKELAKHLRQQGVSPRYTSGGTR